ncbi:MAG TPA: ECF-type sigma factor [Candidatus Polarisedimenticolia bacterium]|nr:ECF-type sigma factor [Candidatus Polarisedimenticolia bacterium]
MDTTLPALMEAADRGDQAARNALFAALYGELHAMARRELARPGAPVSLGATTLLHQAYLDMAARHGLQFPDRPRFMGYAARVMRGVIIDHARSRQALRRGGRLEITGIDSEVPDERAEEADLRAIGEALDALAKVDEGLAQVVDLKFFCGFSFAEIAALRGVSERTVQRQWEKARIYLHRALRGVRLV